MSDEMVIRHVSDNEVMMMMKDPIGTCANEDEKFKIKIKIKKCKAASPNSIHPSRPISGHPL